MSTSVLRSAEQSASPNMSRSQRLDETHATPNTGPRHSMGRRGTGNLQHHRSKWTWVWPTRGEGARMSRIPLTPSLGTTAIAIDAACLSSHADGTRRCVRVSRACCSRICGTFAGLPSLMIRHSLSLTCEIPSRQTLFFQSFTRRSLRRMISRRRFLKLSAEMSW